MKSGTNLILETKGYDPKEDVKAAAAQRWVSAVNADGAFGTWVYAVAHSPNEVPKMLSEIAMRSESEEVVRTST
jgi:type III restriction enzyme